MTVTEILSTITKDDILNAINNYVFNENSRQGRPVDRFVSHENKDYPAKELLKQATPTLINASNYSNNSYTSDVAQKRLEELGFKVVKKNQQYSFDWTYYIKRVLNQDVERNFSISNEAATDFFMLELNNGQDQQIQLNYLEFKQKITTRFNKRNTRNEYRFFPEYDRDDVEEDDILLFTRSDQGYSIEIIRWNNRSNFKSINNLLGLNNHLLTNYLTPNKSTQIKTNFISMHPLNQILFGPPGTGKTYNTINYSLQILGVDTSKMQRDEITRLFKEKVIEGQIVFTTFHQSMSYEEFIEGIKPQLENNNDSETANLSYTIENGIFKDLVDRIVDAKVFAESEKTDLFIDPKLFDQNVNKVSLGNSQDANDDVIYDYCMANDCIVIGFGEDIDFSGVTSRSDIRKRFQDNGFPISDAMDFNVSAIERLVLWMKPGQLVFVSEGLSKLKAIGKVVGDYYCDPSTSIRYSQFRRVQWLYKDLELPIKEIYGKTFSQQTIYQMDPRKIDQSFFSGNSKQEGLSNYVLIIDEINRGNVSSIFGELITLLEPDKRKGECEELSLILPYSKRPFAIPNNLYIIGTMNTADRSVEALDTALRRRFSFVEMLPDASKLNGKEIQGINLELLLNTMNERIEVLVDRDHTIGHAFFMNTQNVHDLRTAFGNKIIPLLQEYFYGNYQKMEMVIGSAFFKITEANKVKFAAKTEDFDADGKVYHILDVTNPEVISDDAFIAALSQLIQGV